MIASTVIETSEVADPTNCDRCRVSLEHGWSERWRDNQRVGAFCFNCDDADRLRDYLATGVLTTKFMVRASIENVNRECGKGVTDPVASEALARAWASTEAVQRAVKHFEQTVWFGGLADKVRMARHRGFRAGFDVGGEKHDVLVWSCAGRAVFTIEPADESRQVSLICAENSDESTMGIQGICATEEQAVAMLSGACAAWANGMRFERDDKVGMF